MDHNKTTEETTSTKEKRLKSLPATYEPDIRTSGWLKLKKDYVDGMSDSLDLIPVGGWHGNGRKARWWSPVLLALWDPEIGRPVAVCKCMSGKSYYELIRQSHLTPSMYRLHGCLLYCEQNQHLSRFRQHVNCPF